MSRGVVFWEFAGVLAERREDWPALVEAVLREQAPTVPLRQPALQAFLETAFPWGRPHEPHPDWTAADWWAALARRLALAARVAGAPDLPGERLAAALRARYGDPRAWGLYPDAAPMLAYLISRGWRNVVFANQTPDLPDLVAALGLAPLVEAVLPSAALGYEKPHPESYRRARAAVGPAPAAWLVSASLGDVLGAERAGLPAILVRRDDPRAPRFSPTLRDVIDIIVDDASR